MLYIAHIDKSYKIHDLEDHLQSVANLTKSALPDRLKKLGYVSGLWHDIGKYRPNFQGYISVVSGYDTTKTYDPYNKSHSSAGMFLAKELLTTTNKPAIFGISAIQYVIGCHHTGLLDGIDSSGGRSMQSRLSDPKYHKEYTEVKELYNSDYNVVIPDAELCIYKKTSKAYSYTDLLYSLDIRMMFSAMVDADFTDTALFMNKHRKKHLDYPFKDISALAIDINNHMAKKTITAIPSIINTIRQEVLRDCMDAAAINQNVFTLSVPTGGGKTLASMAFALNHAKLFNKDRVIVSIPYTSIIEQNANVYKDIFGEGNVLEHHSNIDVDDVHMFNPHLKLAAENWNAPIVVTTNVQLFESLFANRTSKCRKLHNIQNSVIVLDEAQTIPTELLAPTLAYLRLLVEEYNVTIVFCTATQPCINTITQSDGKTYVGFDSPYEIIKDTTKLYNSLNRVKIHLPEYKETIEEVSDKIAMHPTVLAVFSTRKNAQNAFDLVKAKSKSKVFHLSATMCPAHRTKKLNEVKQYLCDGIPIILISTQVVEAGVDIDFPIVYRELSGLDSIAQASGRCNREGKLEYGEVFLMNLETKLPPEMQKPITITKQVFRDRYFEADNVIGQKNVGMFFRNKSYQELLDKHNIIDGMLPKYGKEHLIIDLKFATVANNYKIVKEEDSNTIIVCYDNGSELEELDLTSEEDIQQWMTFKFQKYSVICRDSQVNKLCDLGYIRPIAGLHKTYLMIDSTAYHDDKGLVI